MAAHAGVDFEKGASAIRELARVVETVSGWTDLKRGMTVNVGTNRRRQQNQRDSRHMPGRKWMCALPAKPTGRASSANLPRSKPADKRCKLTVTGGINRPPMERGRGTVALYQKARALAAELGFALDEAATGGASDGNFTAALGVPTLDGLGAVGEGAHAPQESVVVEHLAPRTALLAALLAG